MNYVIHTDGGSRGNPGPAAIGVVIEAQNEKGTVSVASYGKFIGETTNNVAEYNAVKDALETLDLLAKQKEDRYEFILDSLLVVNQLNGLFKVKDATLRHLLATIRILEQKLGGHISYRHVPRSENVDADAQVNAALDQQLTL